MSADRDLLTTLILVRHGESVANAAGRIQGQQDHGLTAAGRAQALALQRAFAQWQPAAVYASDLGRAADTARLMCEGSAHTVQLDPRLRECHFGLFEGLAWGEVGQRYPEHSRQSRDPNYVIPGGESRLECSERAVATCLRLCELHQGETVVAVSHGGVIGAVLRYALGVPMEARSAFHINNTSVSRFRYSDERLTVESFGEVSHLRDVPLPG